ncbi:MAG: hypothetical protein [Wendovervirus sonii]|uniref:Endonuclease V n=1 Tax=phage Lak_Megaphage_Sonny TaxID=3109229 RepID=A0ABZ0Z3T2_9CAUD|nr:MAG: hypothetical protein [phage Lak_Megaphage_Sonny]
MKLILDICYNDESNTAHVAGVLFEQWTDKTPAMHISCDTDIQSEYISGQFYRRELPCIQALLETLDMNEIDTIIVDGFYSLGENHPGLGQHLYEDYLVPKGFGNIEVVGISKSYMFNCENFSFIVNRPSSKHPLYVNGSNPNTDYGLLVSSMHGRYRLPTLVKMVDQYSREILK